MNERAVYLYQHLFPVDVAAYFRQEGTLNRTRTSYSSQLFIETEISLALSFNWVNKSDYVAPNSWRYFASTRHRQFALFVTVGIPTTINVFCFSFCLLNDITKKIAILRRVKTCSLIKTYWWFRGMCSFHFLQYLPSQSWRKYVTTIKVKVK
jgi:hypothetical protein